MSDSPQVPGQQYPEQYPGQPAQQPVAGPPYPGQDFHPQFPGQPDPYARPPRKPKKKWYQRVWFWILAVIAIIVVISIAVNASGGGSSAEPVGSSAAAGKDAKPAKKPAKEKEKVAGLGDTVKAGDFEFSVTKVKDGVTKVGNEYANKKAQGQFIEVSVTVKNVGDDSQIFMGDGQKLVDGDGKQYSADSEAGIYLDDSNSLLEEINPGNTSKGVIIFDVPKDVTPKFIEFTGSLFGSPVKVALS